MRSVADMTDKAFDEALSNIPDGAVAPAPAKEGTISAALPGTTNVRLLSYQASVFWPKRRTSLL